MANSEAPPPESTAGTPPAPQRHVSGMLLLSLFLSIGGFLAVPVIGALGGLIFATFGRKKVIQNPLLIGPGFAMVCIAIAVLSLPTQLWLVYQSVPRFVFLKSMGELHGTLFEQIRSRDWQGLYDSMHVDYRDTHTADEVEEALAAAFPGEGEIVLPEENLKFNLVEDEAELEKIARHHMAFVDGEFETLDLDANWSILFPETEEQVDLDLRIRVHRGGRFDFKARILNFTVARVPLKCEQASVPDEGAGEEPTEEPTEEPGKTDE